MGMDSAKLSQRARQPGHDQTFRDSEKNFVRALETILDPSEWHVEPKPKELLKIFGKRYGIKPDARITFKPNGRVMYFEVKKQGKRGNAEERASKHHTVQFYKTLHEITGLDYHPYVSVMCEALATHERYTLKHPFFYEDGHYFNWVDYDLDLLADFLAVITTRWMTGASDGEPQQVPE